MAGRDFEYKEEKKSLRYYAESASLYLKPAITPLKTVESSNKLLNLAII